MLTEYCKISDEVAEDLRPLIQRMREHYAAFVFCADAYEKAHKDFFNRLQTIYPDLPEGFSFDAANNVIMVEKGE